MTRAWTGAVLAGGRSSRMGRDKAFVEVDGVAMAARARASLAAAGADEVLAVGGDAAGLRGIGFDWRADHHPGAGPLGGIITALREARHEVVVVVACDMPWIDPAVVRRLLLTANPASVPDAANPASVPDAANPASVPDAANPASVPDAVVPVHLGRMEPLLAVYRRRALPALSAAFESGERAPHRALARLDVTVVTVDARSLTNVNEPDDLPYPGP